MNWKYTKTSKQIYQKILGHPVYQMKAGNELKLDIPVIF
jgi:hypothetical protein